MGIRELRVKASELGIKNYSKLSKVDLEAAVAAKQTVRSDTSAKLGEVDGRPILVTGTDTVETIGALLGTFTKSNARKVRRMLAAAGYRAFSACQRKVVAVPAEKAA